LHTKHGRNFPDRRLAVLVNRFCSKVTDRVVAVSADAAAVARDIEKVDPARLQVIVNGVDVRRYVPPAGRRADCVMVVCVARLDPVKDIPSLLKALSIARVRSPSLRLTLVGEGPDRGRITEVRAQLGLEAEVALVGHQADIRPFLADADAFALASVSEGISLTLLEAMASGLPVVATDVGGNREVVIPQVTGLLVPSRNPVALAAALEKLASSAALRRSMGSAGRRRVEENFDVRTMTSRYEELYAGLLGESAIAP